MRRRLTELLWSMFLRAKFLAFCFLRGVLIESCDAADVTNTRVRYCLIHQLMLDLNFILFSSSPNEYWHRQLLGLNLLQHVWVPEHGITISGIMQYSRHLPCGSRTCIDMPSSTLDAKAMLSHSSGHRGEREEEETRSVNLALGVHLPRL